MARLRKCRRFVCGPQIIGHGPRHSNGDCENGDKYLGVTKAMQGRLMLKMYSFSGMGRSTNSITRVDYFGTSEYFSGHAPSRPPVNKLRRLLLKRRKVRVFVWKGIRKNIISYYSSTLTINSTTTRCWSARYHSILLLTDYQHCSVLSHVDADQIRSGKAYMELESQKSQVL